MANVWGSTTSGLFGLALVVSGIGCTSPTGVDTNASTSAQDTRIPGIEFTTAYQGGYGYYEAVLPKIEVPLAGTYDATAEFVAKASKTPAPAADLTLYARKGRRWWGVAVSSWSYAPQSNTYFVNANATGYEYDANANPGEEAPLPTGVTFSFMHIDPSSCVLSPDQPDNDDAWLDPRTGQRQVAVCGTFLSYWKDHGGLEFFGWPIDPYYDDGEGFRAQWFERNRFENHNGKIMLGRLGAELHGEFRPGVGGQDGCKLLDPTGQNGHNICGPIQAYFDAHGGIPTLGYPLDEATEEKAVVGNTERTITVQWFERARIEYHAYEAEEKNRVKLGLLGMEARAQASVTP